ncbi:MAG: hypothetical protein J6T72_04100 [Alphaproteobacteria bacterium]|nr:hypothetical protein [Alphaproteobacteria bacterium]
MFKKILFLFLAVVAFGTVAHSQVMQSEEQSEEGKHSVFFADYDIEQIEFKKCEESVINNSPAKHISCLNQEIKRQHGYIENFYRTLLKQQQFQEWNGGDTLAKGNFKDMNEQFVAFRDRLCSLYALAKKPTYENLEWGRKECIMIFNDYMLNRLQTIKYESDGDYSTAEDFEADAPGEFDED